jgi:hypothetical protein
MKIADTLLDDFWSLSSIVYNPNYPNLSLAPLLQAKEKK